LPRQARDKHRESSTYRFSSGGARLRLSLRKRTASFMRFVTKLRQRLQQGALE
jgi:hypothetical protein